MLWTNGMSEFDIINAHANDLTQGIWFEDGEGNPIGRRPMGYPMFLGLLYSVFGAHNAVAWTSSLILYIATTLLIFGLGKELFSAPIGLIAALFFSIYPDAVLSIKMVTDEHLFLPVWYLGLYLLVRELGGAKMRFSWLWYGLIFGFSTMIRTHTIFMPVVISAAYFAARMPWKKVFSGFLLTMLVMQMINVPWVMRNYKAWDSFVLYTATAPFIYAAYNPTAPPEACPPAHKPSAPLGHSGRHCRLL